MINRRIWKMLAMMVVVMWCSASQAQKLALKTNLLYDASTTPNIGAEFGLGRRMTGQLFYGLNPWTYGGSGTETKKAKHWVLMPELRWWTCSKMNGWFIGVHGMGGEFNGANVKVPTTGAFFKGLDVFDAVRNTRVEGHYLGGGLTVGYQWILSRHWNIEAEVGAGYNRVWYDQFPCAECGTKLSEGRTHYAGLTKAGISLMYVF